MATTQAVPRSRQAACSHHMLQRLSSFDEGLQPIVSSGTFKTSEGRDCLYRAILLPFVSASNVIELVVGGARCKAVSSAGG